MHHARRFTQHIHAKLTSRRTVDRLMVWVVGLGAVLLVVEGLLYYGSNQSVIDQSIVAEAEFPVYAPSRAPQGYELHKEYTSLSDTMLTYGFTERDTSDLLTVTVQSRPSGFDVSHMTKGSAVSSTTTDNGTLYDLSVGGSSQYLLDTGDALVYLTSTSQISTATIHAVADSLSKRN